MQSMTGFGRGTATGAGYQVSAEVRSVNHRYLECSVKVPRGFTFLEDPLQKCVAKRLARGKAEMYITLTPTGERKSEVRVDHERIKAYLDALGGENEQLAHEYSEGMSEKALLRFDLGLSFLMRIPDAFTLTPTAIDEDALLSAVMEAAKGALDGLCAMRAAEGEKMKRDIASHLDALEDYRTQVIPLVPESVAQYHEKLYAKLQEILEDKSIEESRLVTEAGIIAERLAVDEELVRLESHVAQFRTLLDESVPVGRKMDFLVQEMNREVNTTGSKSQSLAITHLVVEMKSEIEKIREQIQNVE